MNTVLYSRGVVATVLLTVLLLLSACAGPQLRTTPAVQLVENEPAALPVSTQLPAASLKVMTLNMAHARGDGFHQALQGTDIALANLDSIRGLLQREVPDVVALQEVDEASFWNGGFSHAAWLVESSALTQFVHGAHVQGPGLRYGAALLSGLPLSEPQSLTFDPARTLVPKGMVVSTITWPGTRSLQVDVVSVHLDFLSQAVRHQQVTELVALLQQRDRPRIIMGDLNSRWEPGSAVQTLAQELGLSVYRAGATDIATFPALGSRLDWVLLSPGFEFRSSRVLEDVVSDHRAVIAEIGLVRSVDARP